MQSTSSTSEDRPACCWDAAILKPNYYKFTCNVCHRVYSVAERNRTGAFAPKGPLRGRPRLGKTHRRSDEAKARRNERKRRRPRTTYRFSGTHLIQNVLDFGSPKNYFGRLEYHRNRYIKQGRTWVQPRNPPSGFRLLSNRSYTLPGLVVKALERIYSVPTVSTKKPSRMRVTSRIRERRNHSQADVVARLEHYVKEDPSFMNRSKKERKMYELSYEEELEFFKARVERAENGLPKAVKNRDGYYSIVGGKSVQSLW